MPDQRLSGRLADRAVVALVPEAGDEDVAGFLQGLVTNDVSGALPVYAGLLSAQGKALFDFLVWPGEDGALLIDCEAGATDEFIKRLSLYRLRRKIAIAVDATLAVHWSVAPVPVPGAVPDPRFSALGWRWLAPADESETADAAWRAHRLRLGIPETRAELGDTLWLETNAAELNGVSFAKGCYVGQENTARMNWRQKINRRLVVVSLSASDEKRRKIAYPELGLAIDHRRVEDIDPAWRAPWMAL